MRKRYLECGRIVSTHGVRGEMKVLPWADSPAYLLGFASFYLRRGERRLDVERARVNGGTVLLKAEGIETLDEAALLRGQTLYLDREDAPDEEGAGRFFVQDLLGLSVVDADSGLEYGKLSDVLQTGANDVYEITGPDGVKRLIPVIREVVLETDIEGGILRIRPLKGLFPDED